MAVAKFHGIEATYQNHNVVVEIRYHKSMANAKLYVLESNYKKKNAVGTNLI